MPDYQDHNYPSPLDMRPSKYPAANPKERARAYRDAYEAKTPRPTPVGVRLSAEEWALADAHRQPGEGNSALLKRLALLAVSGEK